jgi:dipeptidyl aminopeptidase/acylaminoacyl peptidase
MLTGAAFMLVQAVLSGPSAFEIADAGVPCASRNAQTGTADTDKANKLSSSDLAGIADIGRSDPNESASPFGISPDGKQIAFLVRRGNPEANAFCQTLVVASLARGGAPLREIDRGGAFIRATFALRNFPVVGAGYAQVITPRWSPDGRRIAFLKRTSSQTQVWVAGAAGTLPARQATSLPDDVEDFRWSADGAWLIVQTRPSLRAENARIAAEARTGFLFDDRFSPQFADRPLPAGPMNAEFSAIDEVGSARLATDAEVRLFSNQTEISDDGVPTHARGYIRSTGRSAAWIESKAPEQLIAPTRLAMRHSSGATRVCDITLCDGARHLWWSADGQNLFVLQKTGWGQSQTGLLHWNIAWPGPKRVFVTEDALIGCAISGSELICARESAARPRRLVAIEAATGNERLIHDPNPEWQEFRMGDIQRMRFRNAFGVESFADLVLPPEHKVGQKHPLVVVQYGSDGFLRGGTGDEVPVQVLAAKGFAVLSFARPDFPAWVMAARDERELRRRNRSDWLDRRSVQSSLEMAITSAVASGAVDADRMGISGFSDGTSTTQWALINSKLFKTASLGACCEDMLSYPLGAGPFFERFGHEMGYRFFEQDAPQFWKPMSLVLNAERIDVPILIQTGDSEYEAGLDVVSAFRKQGKAIELVVLDNEPHFKWQPAHRLAIYERSVDWFRFWLMHEMDCSPGKQAQFARWKAMSGAPAPADLHCAR